MHHYLNYVKLQSERSAAISLECVSYEFQSFKINMISKSPKYKNFAKMLKHVDV